MERDKRHLRELEQLGWKALVVWGCQVKDVDALQRKLEGFMSGR